MREIKYTNRFKRDYKREKSGRHSGKLDTLLMDIVNLLATDRALPRKNFDHPLPGQWSDHRDCHIKPDLILIYRKPDDDTSNWCALAHMANLVCERAASCESITERPYR
jgi:mRNA interferase YafQ